MSLEAKNEAAWVRFNEGDLSWSELEARFRVSNGTIARMSQARKVLLEAKQNPAEVRWRDARSRKNTSAEDFDYVAHVSKAARDMADQLKSVGNFSKNPEITAKAIALVNEAMPQALTQWWQEEEIIYSEGDDTHDVLEVDTAAALTIVAGRLQAAGQGALAQQIREVLRDALEEDAARFRL